MLVSDYEKASEVMKVVSDEYSRRIVVAIMSRSLSIEEISREENIPISTCYRRIRRMQRLGLVRVDKTVIQGDGKKYVCYRAAFRNPSIRVTPGEVLVDVIPNTDASDKLYGMWSSMKESDKLEELPSSAYNPVPVVRARIRSE